MKYALLLYDTEGEGPEFGTPEMDAEMQQWFDYTEALEAAGRHLGGEALNPTATATTVRVRDGKTITADGPFAETKEPSAASTSSKPTTSMRRSSGRPRSRSRHTGRSRSDRSWRSPADRSVHARPSPVDHAFRKEWAPLVAMLLHETGSLELAEDAVSEAFVEASVRWRTAGAPRRPGRGRSTTARRKAIDQIRRSRRFEDRLPQLVDDPPEHRGETLGDEQLALIAGCADPPSTHEAQVAPTLRYVCGLTTDQIARSFMVPSETMKKRLTRAKHKISAAGVPFEVPPHDRLADRLAAICGVSTRFQRGVRQLGRSGPRPRFTLRRGRVAVRTALRPRSRRCRGPRVSPG